MAACKAPVYNKLVTLQSPSGVRDGLGERSTTWVDQTMDWASINPLSVRDLLAAGQVQSEISHTVKMRHTAAAAAADHSWRILYGTRVFIILGVRNLSESDRVLEFRCSEGLREEQ